MLAISSETTIPKNGDCETEPCTLNAAVRIGRYSLGSATRESSTYCTHRALAGAVFFGELEPVFS